MFEELYAELPSVMEYLERIGLKERPALTPDGLDKLVFAHQKTVPFENYLLCEENKSVNIGIDALFDKIVRRHRGGYCFELNGLFYSLMTALGFSVYPVLARIHNTFSTHFAPLHRGNIVCFGDDRYFTDVGYGGPMPAGCIRLEDGLVQEKSNGTYRFIQGDHSVWTLQHLEDGAFSDMMSFSENPSDIVDFVSPNFYCSDNPDSFFRKMRLCNIYLDDGYISLTNGELKIFTGGRTTVTKLQSKAEELEVLKKHFGIEL